MLVLVIHCLISHSFNKPEVIFVIHKSIQNYEDSFFISIAPISCSAFIQILL